MGNAIIVFLSQSMHKPQHQQARGDDSLSSNRKLRQQFVTGGSPIPGALAVKQRECRRTHN